MLSVLVAAVLSANPASDCKNCQNPRIIIRVPGVSINIDKPKPPPKYHPVPLRPTYRYLKVGLFGKVKYKYKCKYRAW